MLAALTPSRDALANLSAFHRCVDVHPERHDQGGVGTCAACRSWGTHLADALLASGAVVAADTLAADEAACHALVMTMIDDGHTGFGDCRPIPTSLDVTAANALRALAAALTERGES